MDEPPRISSSKDPFDAAMWEDPPRSMDFQAVMGDYEEQQYWESQSAQSPASQRRPRSQTPSPERTGPASPNLHARKRWRKAVLSDIRPSPQVRQAGQVIRQEMTWASQRSTLPQNTCSHTWEMTSKNSHGFMVSCLVCGQKEWHPWSAAEMVRKPEDLKPVDDYGQLTSTPL